MIPDSVKEKIDKYMAKKYWDYKFDKYEEIQDNIEYGYSLAQQELADAEEQKTKLYLQIANLTELNQQQDKEIEKLFNLAEFRRQEIDRNIIELGKQDAEIERLKGLIEIAHRRGWLDTSHPVLSLESSFKNFSKQYNL